MASRIGDRSSSAASTTHLGDWDAAVAVLDAQRNTGGKSMATELKTLLHSQAPVSVEVQRIRGEFLEMPALTLTRTQAARLFGLEPHICEAVLMGLVDGGFLVRDASARYRRPSAV